MIPTTFRNMNFQSFRKCQIALIVLFGILMELPPSSKMAFCDETFEFRVSTFIASESGVDAREAIESLFLNATESELDELRHHQNDRVATYAAWETILRRIERTKRLNPSVDEKRMSDEVSQWLTGFIEGRLKANVPLKWTSAIKSAVYFDNRTFHIPSKSFWEPTPLPQPDRPAESEKAKANQGAVIRGVRNNVSISVPAKTINRALEETTIESFDAVTVEAKGETVIVILSNKGDSAVIATHAESGKVLWIKRIMAFKGGGSGIWSHSLECAIEHDRVLLFGVFNSWCYIYSLNKSTGEVELEFNCSGI